MYKVGYIIRRSLYEISVLTRLMGFEAVIISCSSSSKIKQQRLGTNKREALAGVGGINLITAKN